MQAFMMCARGTPTSLNVASDSLTPIVTDDKRYLIDVSFQQSSSIHSSHEEKQMTVRRCSSTRACSPQKNPSWYKIGWTGSSMEYCWCPIPCWVPLHGRWVYKLLGHVKEACCLSVQRDTIALRNSVARKKKIKKQSTEKNPISRVPKKQLSCFPFYCWQPLVSEVFC